MNYEKLVKKSVDFYLKNWVILAVSTLVALALGCLTLGLLLGPLFAGLGAMFIKPKAKKPVFDDLFKFNGKFLAMAVMGLLIIILVSIGCVFLLLPGLLLATLWMYAFYAMAFDDKGIIDSMKTSWKIVMKKGLWQHLVILVALGILNSVGAAIVIGIFVTFPLTAGFLAMLYEENK
jgi:hypothetical protein